MALLIQAAHHNCSKKINKNKATQYTWLPVQSWSLGVSYIMLMLGTADNREQMRQKSCVHNCKWLNLNVNVKHCLTRPHCKTMSTSLRYVSAVAPWEMILGFQPCFLGYPTKPIKPQYDLLHEWKTQLLCIEFTNYLMPAVIILHPCLRWTYSVHTNCLKPCCLPPLNK